MPHQTIEEDFVFLAFEIDKYLPGYIDAYFGPSAWQEQARAGGVVPLPELARRASSLATTVAEDSTMDAQRKDYISRHVLSMQTSLRLLSGEKLALADEVELLYDVRPTWVDESVFEKAHHTLDELLPPGDSLKERIHLRKKNLEITVDQARQLVSLTNQHLRSLTTERFPLPVDETLDYAYVQDKPWGAYNWYLGRSRSHIDVNTDLPFRVHLPASLVAHEAYPGHHTELSIKERRLVEQQGWFEHSLTLINSPRCLVSEGIAVCALSVIMSDEAWVAWHTEEIYPRVNLSHLDAQRELLINHAFENIDGVSGNCAFLLYDHGADDDQVCRYMQQYAFSTEQEAHQAIEFMKDPLFRSYTFNYSLGGMMLKALFAQKQDTAHWYTRLLTEPVTPSQIRDWML